MEVNRSGESGNIPARNGRFFKSENDKSWFFNTREGGNIGPYKSEKEAQKGFDDFIDFIGLADAKTLTTFFRSLSENAEEKETAL